MSLGNTMNIKIIKALVWKEWHEQRGRLAFGCVLLMSLMAIGLKSRLLPDEVTIYFISTFLGSFLLPVFVVLGLIAPEREDRSLDTLLAQPLATGTLLGIKLATGLVLCIAPVLGATLVACVMAGAREITVAYIQHIGLGSAAMASVLLIWSLSLSCRQISEARAGAVGLVVLGICLLVFGFNVEKIEAHTVLYWGLRYGNPLAPIRSMSTYPSQQALDHFSAYILVQIPILVGLSIWTAWRFKTLPRTNK